MDDASGVAPDPLPDRNVFIRTDQFSFVREGIPSLAFKFGFAKDTPELQIEHEWRATRYHAPSDDPAQPGVLKGGSQARCLCGGARAARRECGFAARMVGDECVQIRSTLAHPAIPALLVFSNF
jgi:hypothetical protein